MSAVGAAEAMAWAVRDGVGVIVHGHGAPSKDQWQGWLNEYRRQSTALRGVFIYSFGGGPTSAQRNELLQIIEPLRHVPPTIMVTASPVVRGIITALSWFIPQPRRAKVFGPGDLEAAFGALGLDEPARERLYLVIAELADKVERRRGPLPARSIGGHRAGSSPTAS